MKRRNSIAMQASGYTVSGSFAVASTVALLNGKGFSSMFWGALSAMTAAATNEMASNSSPQIEDRPQPVVSETAEDQETATTSGAASGAEVAA